MTKITRKNVFETNSSSTHSMTIMSQEDYDKWKSENLYYDVENDSFLTYDELKEKLIEVDKDWYIRNNKPQPNYNCQDIIDDLFSDNSYEYKKYDDYNDCYETDVNYHTTKSGDEIVILCEYGYNS